MDATTLTLIALVALFIANLMIVAHCAIVLDLMERRQRIFARARADFATRLTDARL